MRRLPLVLFFVSVFCGIATSQQSKVITERYFGDPGITFNTPSLSIDEDRFASHAEVMEWISRNIEGKPGAEVKIIGESAKGLPIPVIYLQRPGPAPKLKVWFQGVLHGNEPAGAEALLYLATQLLNDPETSAMLEHLSVAILPIANIDGYVAMDRRSAEGLDLNRDQSKYADRVSMTIKRAFIEWEPDIAYDLHEYQPTRKEYAGFGVRGASISYDVKFLPTGFLNVPEVLRRASVEIFEAEAKKALDSLGYTHNFYFSADVSGDEMILSKGAQSPQSSSTSYALSNAISMLVEVRGIGLGKTSLARRTHSLVIVAGSCLKSAVTHREEIRSIVKTAREETISRKNDIVVTSEPAEKYFDIRLIDLQTSDIIVEKIKVRDALDLKPVLVRSRPAGYIIEAGAEREAEILRLLGLNLEPIKPQKKYSVESYTVKDYEEEDSEWEGIKRVTATTEVRESRRRFPEGAWYISLAQKNANYAVSLLEPESANGFVSFRVTATGPGQQLKIHRVMK
ncbi:MAG: hypothetical protein IH591_12765 [Bacteroidales bacterium]|nr:hypothetical protein [Bacteroidales bacterium]